MERLLECKMFEKYLFQICTAIDEYLRFNAKALYTFYSIGEYHEHGYIEPEVEVGLEPVHDFSSSYEELIPRERGLVARVCSAARRG